MIDLGDFFYIEPVRMALLCTLDNDYLAISNARGVDKSFCALVDKHYPEMSVWQSRSLKINEIKKKIACMQAKGRTWKRHNPLRRHLYIESKQLISLRKSQQCLENMVREFRSLFVSIGHMSNPLAELLGGYKQVMCLSESGGCSIMKRFDAHGHLSFIIEVQESITYELTISDWKRNVVALLPSGGDLSIHQYNDTKFSSPVQQLPKVNRVLEDRLRPLWSITLYVDEIPRCKTAVAIGMQCNLKGLQSAEGIVQEGDFDLVKKLSELVI